MRASRDERVCVVATMASKLWRAGKRGQRSRHTLDAPALEYLPDVQKAHVADELAPVALEYVPARHKVHVAADDEAAPACPCVPAAHAEP